jgi:hypothetical protein
MVSAWIQDIYEFTSGDRRKYYYDTRIKAYRQIREDDPLPPANAVQSVLDEMEKNLKPPI